MKILIVAATTFEVQPFLDRTALAADKTGRSFSGNLGKHSVEVIITGVGMVATALHTGIALSKKRDLAINAGICGSYSRNLMKGTVVNVYEDVLSELGAEDAQGNFLSLEQLKLPGISKFINESDLEKWTVFHELPKVNGITVNTTHGKESSIQKTFSAFHPMVESMEGAAFLAAAALKKVPHIQVRAVSNFVEARNRDNWNIPYAIEQLNDTLIAFMEELK